MRRGDWGSVGEALRAVSVVGSVGGGGGVAVWANNGRGREQCRQSG